MLEMHSLYQPKYHPASLTSTLGLGWTTITLPGLRFNLLPFPLLSDSLCNVPVAFTSRFSHRSSFIASPHPNRPCLSRRCIDRGTTDCSRQFGPLEKASPAPQNVAVAERRAEMACLAVPRILRAGVQRS